MKKKKSKPVKKKKHIAIDTPCSASDMEAFLHIVSHEGHWHDAVVLGKNGHVIVEYADDRS